MGWYESPKQPGVMLGDEAFDAMYEGLKGVAAAYREEFGRKPTLEEVRTLFETQLCSAGDDLVEDLAERTVKQVTIKTVKKPKDQRYGVGDVFAIPISGARFAFGRVMLLDKLLGMLIEVFAKSSDSKALERDVMESGRLFQPLLASENSSLESWRWTVVRSDPTYVKPDEPLEFLVPHPSGEGWCAVNLEWNVLRSVSPEEKKHMISGHSWDPEDVEKHIEEALGRVIN